jgi:PhnB protein
MRKPLLARRVPDFSSVGAVDMTSRKRGLPENSSIVIPRLFCRDPAKQIEFCVAAFDAIELGRRQGPDGGVVHALLTIASEMIMIESEWPTLPSRVPALDGSSPVVIFLYVEDVDAVVERAMAMGAEVIVPVQDQFWGDRMAWIKDPAGHVWTLATRIEETTAEERDERWSQLASEEESSDA